MIMRVDTIIYTDEPEKIITSDRTLHFTNQLVKNESENENISGLSTNTCIINGISVQSKQALIYKLMLWKKNTFNNIDMNLDTYIGCIDIDLTSKDTIKMENNPYRLNIEDIRFIYQDLDSTNTLHISLLNMSDEIKKSGIDGEIKLDIKVSPRL